MILFPIVLILILGTSLSSVFNNDFDISKYRTHLYYTNLDNSSLSLAIEEALNAKEVSNIIIAKKVNSINEINDKEYYAYIKINKNFSQDILNNKKATITVYSNKADNLKELIVFTFLESIIDKTNLAITYIKTNNYSKLSEISKMDTLINDRQIRKTEVPNAMSFYAVTMLILILMYGANYGNNLLFEEIRTNTYIRLKTVPTKFASIFIGKILGCIVTVFIEAIIIIFVSKVFYKANWGSNLPFILLVVFVFSVFVTTLGLFFALLLNDEKRSNFFLQLIIPISTFLSGGYFKIDSPNSIVEKIGHIMPNYIGQNALFNIIYGSVNKTNFYLICLLIATCVLFLFISLLGRRYVK